MEQYPLTKSQKQILLGKYFAFDKKQAVLTNLIEVGIFFEKDFRPEIMEKALNVLFERNDILRIRIEKSLRGKYQYFAPYEEQQFERAEVDDLPGFRDMLNSHIFLIDVFDGQLARARIVACRNENRSGGVIFVGNHIGMDGFSIGLLHQRLETYYRYLRDGQEIPDLKETSYLKVIEAEEKYLNGKSHAEDKKFWKYQYNHQPHYSFPAGRTPFKCDLGQEKYLLEGKDYRALTKLCSENSVSFTSAVMTMISLTVHVLHGDTNFALYTTTHGRTTAPLKRAMGCLMSAYPIFYNIDTKLPFIEYLKKTYSDYLVALSHGRLSSAEQILMAAKETYIKRFGYNHLWFVTSTMDYLEGAEKMESSVMEPPMWYTVGMFYCALLNQSETERLEVEFSYQKKHFSAAQVKHMLATFRDILRLVSEDPSVSIEAVCDSLK